MKKSRDGLIRLIAIFKLIRVFLLVLAGVVAFNLVHNDSVYLLDLWASRLGLNPGEPHVGQAIGKLATVPPDQLQKVGWVSLVYALLFLTEGVGLWLEKRWAEWLTVVITTSFIPVELVEIYRRPTIAKAALLGINIAVVVYLAFRILHGTNEAR